MEMKQISETTLKITMSLEDLDERGMEIKDFLIPQEKTEEFFYSVMDEIDLPDHFKTSGMLSFRVTPKKDRIDVFVTKADFNPEEMDFEQIAEEMGQFANVSPDEFFKSLEEGLEANSHQASQEVLRLAEQEEERMEELSQATGSESSESHVDYTHFVIRFESFNQLLIFVKQIDFDLEASELFKYGQNYYLTVLLDLYGQDKDYANFIYARLLEHGQESTHSRVYLQEHGVQLLYTDAVEQLKLVKG